MLFLFLLLWGFWLGWTIHIWANKVHGENTNYNSARSISLWRWHATPWKHPHDTLPHLALHQAFLYRPTNSHLLFVLSPPPADVDKARLSSQDDHLCRICMDAVIDCVLLECGHMVTCTKCGKRMSECPICRQYVVRAVHVFKSWASTSQRGHSSHHLGGTAIAAGPPGKSIPAPDWTAGFTFGFLRVSVSTERLWSLSRDEDEDLSAFENIYIYNNFYNNQYNGKLLVEMELI